MRNPLLEATHYLNNAEKCAVSEIAFHTGLAQGYTLVALVEEVQKIGDTLSKIQTTLREIHSRMGGL